MRDETREAFSWIETTTTTLLQTVPSHFPDNDAEGKKETHASFLSVPKRTRRPATTTTRLYFLSS
jgi:hypothetical protein